MSAHEQIERTLRLLQGSIRAAGLTQTEVDDRIGRRRGYLSHVFQQRVDLKLVDLLRVLEVLELEAGRFFAVAVTGRSDARSSLEDLIRLAVGVKSGRPGGRSAPAVAARGAQQAERELLERVRAAVRSILAEDRGGARLRRKGDGEEPP